MLAMEQTRVIIWWLYWEVGPSGRQSTGSAFVGHLVFGPFSFSLSLLPSLHETYSLHYHTLPPCSDFAQLGNNGARGPLQSLVKLHLSSFKSFPLGIHHCEKKSNQDSSCSHPILCYQRLLSPKKDSLALVCWAQNMWHLQLYIVLYQTFAKLWKQVAEI